MTTERTTGRFPYCLRLSDEGALEQSKEPRMVLLYSLYEPHQDPADLPPSDVFSHNAMHNIRDLMNVRPKAEPPYSSAERSAVEDWRQRVEQQVTTRISSYRYKPSYQKSTLSYARPSDERPTYTEHRMLQISELRDLILDFAGPAAQIRALHVSRSWRSSVFAIISSGMSANTYRRLLSSRCSAVEHGQLIDENALAPLQPSSEEMRDFEANFDSTYKRWCKARVGWSLYLPAKCAQRRDLPSSLAETLNHLDWSQRDDAFRTTYSVSRETDIYWLDLSQLEINPYLEALFAEEHQSKHRLGRWEICLRKAASSPQTLLLNSFLSSKALLNAIGSMHVTSPPCRALGIYHNDIWETHMNGSNTLLTRIRNDQGVRISELLEALRQVAPIVLEAWFKSTEWLVKEIPQAHWIDNLWRVSGAPTVRIFLDNVDMSDDVHTINSSASLEELDAWRAASPLVLGLSSHITRAAQMNAEPLRRTREKEWISEDLIEPAESTTGRYHINWNS